jgi:hypothetical protein
MSSSSPQSKAGKRFVWVGTLISGLTFLISVGGGLEPFKQRALLLLDKPFVEYSLTRLEDETDRYGFNIKHIGGDQIDDLIVRFIARQDSDVKGEIERVDPSQDRRSYVEGEFDNLPSSNFDLTIKHLTPGTDVSGTILGTGQIGLDLIQQNTPFSRRSARDPTVMMKLEQYYAENKEEIDATIVVVFILFVAALTFFVILPVLRLVVRIIERMLSALTDSIESVREFGKTHSVYQQISNLRIATWGFIQSKITRDNAEKLKSYLWSVPQADDRADVALVVAVFYIVTNLFGILTVSLIEALLVYFLVTRYNRIMGFVDAWFHARTVHREPRQQQSEHAASRASAGKSTTAGRPRATRGSMRSGTRTPA